MAFVRTHLQSGIVALLVIALVTIGLPLFMRLSMQSYMFDSTSDLPTVQVAIVPGASVYDGEPSPVLQQRAQTAILLYETGKVSKILVSGDNSALNHDEVTPVRKYLIDAGIPPRDIFLDHAGFDTYSAMYRAFAVFDVHSAIIVTQDFHLPRALYLARHLGLEAYGFKSEGGQGTLSDYVREIPAAWKALFDLLSRRQPKYLGPVISISGDGRATW
ncbi:MAG TPA: ElyC/SanA/YdcF family protein [Candidatus Paceibacterota bacterium]|nr:ElyC/SanA/YdcF family protein [Candidatus Paceibacterota bacterium]